MTKKINYLNKVMKQEISRNMIFFSLIKFSSIFLSVVLGVAIARILGPQEFGKYSFLLSVISIALVVTKLGFPRLLSREIAIAEKNKKWGEIKALLNFSSLVVLCILIILSITLFSLWLFNLIEDMTILVSAFSIVFFNSFIALKAGALEGFRKVVIAQVPEKIIYPLSLLTGVIFFSLFSENIQSAHVIIINAICSLIAFILGYVFFKVNYPLIKKQNEKHDDKKQQWIKSALLLTLIAGIQQINTNADILILGFLSSNEAMGFYRASTQGSVLVTLSIQVISGVLMPYFSRLNAKENRFELQRLITKSTRFCFFSALIIFLTYLIWGKEIINLVFGSQYSNSYYTLIILSFAQTVNAFFGPIVLISYSLGREKIVAKAMTYAVLANIVLNFPLIILFDEIGAAIATGITLILWNLFVWKKLLNKDSINCTPNISIKLLKK